MKKVCRHKNGKRKVIRNILMLVLLFFALINNINAQDNNNQNKKVHVTIAFGSNIPSAPWGCSIFLHLSKISFYTNFRYGKTAQTGSPETHDDISSDVSWYGSYPLYDNTGIYQVGTWGNVPVDYGNGTLKSYTSTTDIATYRKVFDIGVATNIKKSEFYSLKVFAGAGINIESKVSTTNTEIWTLKQNLTLVNDTYHVINPPSYMYVVGVATSDNTTTEQSITTKRKNKLNINFGLLYTYKKFSIGIGMDTSPIGADAMLGITF